MLTLYTKVCEASPFIKPIIIPIPDPITPIKHKIENVFNFVKGLATLTSTLLSFIPDILKSIATNGAAESDPQSFPDSDVSTVTDIPDNTYTQSLPKEKPATSYGLPPSNSKINKNNQ